MNCKADKPAFQQVPRLASGAGLTPPTAHPLRATTAKQAADHNRQATRGSL